MEMELDFNNPHCDLPLLYLIWIQEGQPFKWAMEGCILRLGSAVMFTGLDL